MPKINAPAKVGLKQFLNACTDEELRQLARLLKKDPYRSRINYQTSIFDETK